MNVFKLCVVSNHSKRNGRSTYHIFRSIENGRVFRQSHGNSGIPILRFKKHPSPFGKGKVRYNYEKGKVFNDKCKVMR